MQNHLQLPLFSKDSDKSESINEQIFDTLGIKDSIIGEHFLDNGTKILYAKADNTEKIMIYVVSSSLKLLHKGLFKDVFSNMFFSKGNISAIELSDKPNKRVVTTMDNGQYVGLMNTNDSSLLQVPLELDVDYSITSFNTIEIGDQVLYEIKLTKGNNSSYIFYNPLVCDFVKFDRNYILRNYQSIKSNKYGNFISSGDLLNNKIYFLENSLNYNSLDVDNAYHIYGIGIVVQQNNKRYIVDKIINNKLVNIKFVINELEIELLDDMPTLNAPSHFTIPGKQFYSVKINGLEYIILEDNIAKINMGKGILVNGFDALTKSGTKILATKQNIKYEITRDENNINARQIF